MKEFLKWQLDQLVHVYYENISRSFHSAGRGRKKDDISFDDDDDLLGGIGLDSPRKTKESPTGRSGDNKAKSAE